MERYTGGCWPGYTAETTATAAQPLEPSGLVNPSFEFDAYAAGSWISHAIPPGWQVTSTVHWWMYRPTATDTWPQPTHGSQYIWLDSSKYVFAMLRDMETGRHAKQRAVQ